MYTRIVSLWGVGYTISKTKLQLSVKESVSFNKFCNLSSTHFDLFVYGWNLRSTLWYWCCRSYGIRMLSTFPPFTVHANGVIAFCVGSYLFFCAFIFIQKIYPSYWRLTKTWLFIGIIRRLFGASWASYTLHTKWSGYTSLFYNIAYRLHGDCRCRIVDMNIFSLRNGQDRMEALCKLYICPLQIQIFFANIMKILISIKFSAARTWANTIENRR